MDVVLLIVGVLLLAGAALAGSRVHAIGVDRIGATARLTIAGIGVMCVVAAVILLASGSPKKGSVSATVMCILDASLASDEITVFLDGRSVGVLRVNERSPEAQLPVSVAKAGRHEYRLQSKRRPKGAGPAHATHAGNLVIDGELPLIIYYSTDRSREPFLSQPLKY